MASESGGWRQSLRAPQGAARRHERASATETRCLPSSVRGDEEEGKEGYNNGSSVVWTNTRHEGEACQAELVVSARLPSCFFGRSPIRS